MGPERFETDRLCRLMRYRGSREEDFAGYHPDAERIFTSFADRRAQAEAGIAARSRKARQGRTMPR